MPLLFRYRSLSGQSGDWTKDILRSKKLYFASPTAFNDPFDCRPVFDMSAPNKEVKRYYSGVLKRQAPQLNREARRAESKRVATNPSGKLTSHTALEDFKKKYDETITQRIGLLCLSESATEPLMWSHYADSHSGVCLAFDWSEPFFAKAQEIIYAKERPIIKPVFNDNETMLEHALLTKSSDWQYEKEWRILHYRSGAGSFPFPPNSLKAVILGARISNPDREGISALVRETCPNTSIHEAKVSPRHFRIQIEPPISIAPIRA